MENRSRLSLNIATLFILFFIITLIPLTSLQPAPVIELTKANFESATSGEPVIALVFFPCGISGNVLSYALKDGKGFKVAPVSVTGNAPFTHPDYETNSIFLIHKGKILDSFVFGPGNELGTSSIQLWTADALEKHKFPFQLKRPSALRLPPLTETDSGVNLNKGMAGFFDFDNQVTNKAIEASGEFVLNTGSKNFQLINQTLTGDGNYFNGGDDRRLAHYYDHKVNPKETGLTLHFNYKPVPQIKDTADKEFSLGIVTLDNQVLFKVTEGKFLLDLISDRNVSKTEYQTANDLIYIEDKKVQFHRWYGIVMRLDFKTRRISVLIDGKLSDDIVMNDAWYHLLNDNKKSYTTFYYGRGGRILSGSIDNLVIYNRPLNLHEMHAVFQKYKKEQIPGDVPGIIDQKRRNTELLNAAYDGDLKGVKQAIALGADINASHQGWTSLMYAAYFGREEMVRTLIGHGANPHLLTEGFDAERLARDQGHSAIADFLASKKRSSEFCSINMKYGNVRSGVTEKKLKPLKP